MSVEVSLTYQAGGNILPMSVVKRDTANDRQVLQAGAGDTPLGIAADWTRYPPWSAIDDTLNSISGENVKVFLPGHKGCKAILDTGSGAVTPGTLLKPAASGYLTPVTTDKDAYIAQATVAGVGNGIVDVDVMFGEVSM